MAKLENEYMLNKVEEISVGNFYFFSDKLGLELFSGTLSAHSLTNGAGESEDVKGGRDNEILYNIPKSNSFSLEITDVFNDQGLSCLKFGDSLKKVGTAKVKAFHMPKNYVVQKDSVGGGLYIEVINEPIDGEDVVAYNTKTKTMIDSSKFTQDTTNKSKFKISDVAISEGDNVFVTGFSFYASAEDKYSAIKSMGTNMSGKLIVEIPLFDSEMNIVAYKQFIFHKANISSKDATSTGQTERKAVEAKSTFKIIKDVTQNDLGTIIYLSPEESVTESI